MNVEVYRGLGRNGDGNVRGMTIVGGDRRNRKVQGGKRKNRKV